jgi:hypothetical protein
MRVGGQRHAPAALPPGMTRYPLYRRLGRPQGRSGRVLKILPPLGFDPRAAQLVASCYTDCAVPAHGWYRYCLIIQLSDNSAAVQSCGCQIEGIVLCMHKIGCKVCNKFYWLSTKIAVNYIIVPLGDNSVCIGMIDKF